MPWWLWAALLLAWVVLACGLALWLGASVKVVQAREREHAPGPWEDDDGEPGVPAPRATPGRPRAGR